ncbi:MAG: nucleotidyltransferase [Chitinophagales bacterium]|jgi:predicted nucleotidyltransferase|nr:nucleotidyltransferase [Chitinophagales bacterium]
MNQYLFNIDFLDFLKALNDKQVEYILVGGYAVVLHGYNRNTGDMNIWVNATAENYNKLTKAFYAFSMPTFDMTLEKFLLTDQYDVFSFGRPPVCIDILTMVKGLYFAETFNRVEYVDIKENLPIPILCLADLIVAKKAAGRAKDIDDIENLLPPSL